MLTRVVFAVVLTACPAAAFELSLPVDCRIGTECFIQQYADHDAGPGTSDYACGGQTYDGHDGTDIRVASVADVSRGVPVIAAAQGQIIGARDGMDDHLVRSKEDRAAIADRECGNGVLIDHDDGWQTQYCHLRKGSVTVKRGDYVQLGAKLGEIGYSGDAAFPHVHLTVRKDKKPLDPFKPEGGSVCGMADNALWSQVARSVLAYQAGELLHLGFSDRPVELPELEQGTTQAAVPRSGAEALLAYMWGINLQKDDAITLTLSGADGTVLAANTETLDRNKAQYMRFVGKKRPQGGWPTGIYKATVEVTRKGAMVINRTGTLIID